MIKQPKKILFIGSGAWASALANVLLINKQQVLFYSINKQEASDLKQGFNTKYFAQKKFFAKPYMVSDDLKKLLACKPDFIVFAVPSTALNSTLQLVVKNLVNKPIFVNAIKGLNYVTLSPCSIEIKKAIKNKAQGLVTLIGPSYAIEVFHKQFTTMNCVSSNPSIANKVKNIFQNTFFKCVYCNDEVGAEFCASLKNVMAIACGLTYQLHLSINTRAIIFTQALKEIYQVVTKKGGNPTTILNFCGVGDIFLTCNDPKSRNFTFGSLIAKHGIKQALNINKKTVEGIYALKIVKKIVTKEKIKAPIIQTLYKVVYQNLNHKQFVKEAIKAIAL